MSIQPAPPPDMPMPSVDPSFYLWVAIFGLALILLIVIGAIGRALR